LVLRRHVSVEADALQKFAGVNLTRTLVQIEESLHNVTRDDCGAALASFGARSEVLGAAGLIKGLASQIHVTIHALRISPVTATHFGARRNRRICVVRCWEHGASIRSCD
jgi:hypothetical protein